MTPHVQFDRLTPLPNREDHGCIGCSPSNEHGLRMRFHTDGRSVYSRLVIPAHFCGWDNLAHGGTISIVLDEVMSWGAISLLNRFILTKSITVDFLKPILIGEEILAGATVEEQVSDRQAVMRGSIWSADGELSARSHGTFALMTLDRALAKGIITESAAADFARIRIDATAR